MLSYGWQLGLVHENPFIRLPKMRKTAVAEKVILTMAEIDAVLAAAEPDLRYALLIVAFEGLRRGEVAHLCWEDIDRGQGLVHVINRPPEFSIKTYEARSIPLAARIRAELPEGRTGRIWTKDERSLSWAATELCKDLNVKAGLHLFRHTWVTYLLLCGYPVAQVMSWAGHSSIATTQGYLHVRRQIDAQDVEKFRGAWANTSLTAATT
jgi:integrase/recombinase XerD